MVPLPKPKKTKKRRKAKKVKAYSSADADKEFSLFIRARDKVCMRCGKNKNLTNSHFWGRMHSGTRYDPENCDALCWLPCHYQAEHEKQGWYRDFKLEQLGAKKFAALEKRARAIVKRSDALLAVRELLKNL